MDKDKALKGRNKIYSKFPKHLNQLGFEMALLVNLDYSPNAESLKVFYREYDKVRNK